MGLRLSPGSAGGGRRVEGEARRSRFASYYPRVFAYVQCRTGDEGVTREVLTEAFVRVFSRAGELREEEFRLALFGAARDVMETLRVPLVEEGLTERERDLVSLLFDGLLDHREVARLLHIEEERVTADLMRALRKLRSGKRPSFASSFLRAT